MPRARKPGSGGPRQGTPGVNYTNRTDLQQNRQPIRTAPNQTYGLATAQAASQKSLPLPGQPSLPPQASPTALAATTQRPNEPLTAGMNTGAGAGPEAVTPPAAGQDDSLEATIRGLYAMYTNSDLAKLVAQVSTRRSDQASPMAMQIPAATGQPAPKALPHP